ncbi:hypothetical protein Tco_1461100, partial [Tanacetum coccineum]
MATEPRRLSAVGGNGAAVVMMRAGKWWRGSMVGMMEVLGVELWRRWCREMKAATIAGISPESGRKRGSGTGEW